MEQINSQGLQPGTKHHHLDGIFFLKDIIISNGTKESIFLPKVGLVLANMSWEVVYLHSQIKWSNETD
jgi:hypothetical protein